MAQTLNLSGWIPSKQDLIENRTNYIAVGALCTMVCVMIILLLVIPAEIYMPKQNPVGSTALLQYVSKKDNAFNVSVLQTVNNTGSVTIILNVTSQFWLSPNEILNERSTWFHYVVITIPKDVRGDQALLIIGGGSNSNAPPTGAEYGSIATMTNSVVAELRLVPNQPIQFAATPSVNRKEDAIIAYSWRQFVATGNVEWIAQLPMTKSAVMAMNAVQQTVPSVQSFVVSGASKRGWTTWLTAAVDQRVKAIIPLVFDMLNIRALSTHVHKVYCFYPAALKDYVENGFFNNSEIPSNLFDKLTNIVDPLSYASRLGQIPKYIISSTGDQFFTPDSSQFYYDSLPGEKLIRYVPNSDHSLAGTDAVQSVMSYYIIAQQQNNRPKYTWKLGQPAPGSSSNTNTLTMTITGATQDPSFVYLWQITSPRGRDFRLNTTDALWQKSPVLKDKSSTGTSLIYVAAIDAPVESGTYKAFMMEAVFDYFVMGQFPLKFTTSVYVTPNTLPCDSR